MPGRLNWTTADDAELRRLRAGGADWEIIADALGVSRNAAIERARRLRARIRRCVLVTVVREDLMRPPLPPGDKLSWGILVAGTVLEGEAYQRPGPLGRMRGPVVGESC